MGGVLTTKITAVAMAVAVEVEVEVEVAMVIANVVDTASFKTRLHSRLLPCRHGLWRQR